MLFDAYFYSLLQPFSLFTTTTRCLLCTGSARELSLSSRNNGSSACRQHRVFTARSVVRTLMMRRPFVRSFAFACTRRRPSPSSILFLTKGGSQRRRQTCKRALKIKSRVKKIFFSKGKSKEKKNRKKVKASEFAYRARQLAWIEAASHPRFYIAIPLFPSPHILYYALLHSFLLLSIRFGSGSFRNILLDITPVVVVLIDVSVRFGFCSAAISMLRQFSALF